MDEEDEPNVARKSGCSYCHQVLEPAAAHWGRFSEQGSAWLDPSRYPVDQPACRLRDLDPLLETACERHYLSEREPIGRLRAYEFAFDGTALGESVGRNADAGPPALVSQAIADGRFATCAVRRWWSFLLHRALTEDELAYEVPRLAERFAEGGYRLRGLLRELVTHPTYRRNP